MGREEPPVRWECQGLNCVPQVHISLGALARRTGKEALVRDGAWVEIQKFQRGR